MAFVLFVQLVCVSELLQPLGFVIEIANWRRAFGAAPGHPTN
jgi:hypothetical protein